MRRRVAHACVQYKKGLGASHEDGKWGGEEQQQRMGCCNGNCQKDDRAHGTIIRNKCESAVKALDDLVTKLVVEDIGRRISGEVNDDRTKQNKVSWGPGQHTTEASNTTGLLGSAGRVGIEGAT